MDVFSQFRSQLSIFKQRLPLKEWVFAYGPNASFELTHCSLFAKP